VDVLERKHFDNACRNADTVLITTRQLDQKGERGVTNRLVRTIGAACLVCAIGVSFAPRGALAQALTAEEKIANQQHELDKQKAKIERLEKRLRKLEGPSPEEPTTAETKIETELKNLEIEKRDLEKFRADTTAAVISAQGAGGDTSKVPGGNVPTAFNPSAPSGIINDIACRPKLTFYNPKPGYGLKPGTPPEDPDNSTLAPKYGYVANPPSIGRIKGGSPWGREMYVAPGQVEPDYCNPLYPITRLFIENLFATVNDGYTNVAGSANAGAGVPITQTTGNTYQAGFGYMQKPLLKQFRALLPDGGIPWEVKEQGTFWEDFVFNAFTMNAGFSYGKTLTIKNGTTAIQTLNSRPSYFVAGGLSWNLERMYIHLAHPGSRTADDGYYYQAPCPAFWEGSKCPQAPEAANWTDPPPTALSN